jgi:predicted DNA-binding transcriptional regulator AlpA
MRPYQTSSATPIPTYLRAPEVAQMLNIGLSTWWAWQLADKAPNGVKLNGCRRWAADEIRAFAEGRV